MRERSGRGEGGGARDLSGRCGCPPERYQRGNERGRSCWTVAGTFCFGEVQGTFARKIDDCMECEFFWLVADEEEEFTPSVGSRHCYSKT